MARIPRHQVENHPSIVGPKAAWREALTKEAAAKDELRGCKKDVAFAKPRVGRAKRRYANSSRAAAKSNANFDDQRAKNDALSELETAQRKLSGDRRALQRAKDVHKRARADTRAKLAALHKVRREVRAAIEYQLQQDAKRRRKST